MTVAILLICSIIYSVLGRLSGNTNRLSYLLLYLITDSCIVLKICLRILSSLTYLIAVVCVPCTGLIHYVVRNSKIKNISDLRYTLADHDI